MTSTIGPKGQVVIPKQVRDELGIEPGDRVQVEREGDGVRISRDAIEDPFGSLPGAELDPLEEIEAEHRFELALEEKRIEEANLRPNWRRAAS